MGIRNGNGLATIVLCTCVLSGSVIGSAWYVVHAPREQPAPDGGWRPLMTGEVCPQMPNGHVETFTDDSQGRHWERPQRDGHDIPCGLARPQ